MTTATNTYLVLTTPQAKTAAMHLVPAGREREAGREMLNGTLPVRVEPVAPVNQTHLQTACQEIILAAGAQIFNFRPSPRGASTACILMQFASGEKQNPSEKQMWHIEKARETFCPDMVFDQVA